MQIFAILLKAQIQARNFRFATRNVFSSVRSAIFIASELKIIASSVRNGITHPFRFVSRFYMPLRCNSQFYCLRIAINITLLTELKQKRKFNHRLFKFKQITFIIINFKSSQKIRVFVSKTFRCVVRLLILNIPDYVVQLRNRV